MESRDEGPKDHRKDADVVADEEMLADLVRMAVEEMIDRREEEHGARPEEEEDKDEQIGVRRKLERTDRIAKDGDHGREAQQMRPDIDRLIVIFNDERARRRQGQSRRYLIMKVEEAPKAL